MHKAIDAEKKIDDASAAFGEPKEQLRLIMNDLAKVDEDPNATLVSLSDASIMATDATIYLAKMKEIFSGLDPSTTKADELRIEMMDALEANDQELSALTASINEKHDRIRENQG